MSQTAIQEPALRREPNERATLRWGVYWILIALAVGNAAGRILAVNSVDLARLESYRVQKALSSYREDLEADGLTGETLDAAVEQKKSELEEKMRLQRPFLSSNDRSRWANVRALVEYGTYAIDDVVSQPGWDTIDMVKHKDRHGEPHLYSSKPPLTATILAAPYWVIYQTTGMTLGSDPYVVGRILLLLTNVLPAVVMWALLAGMIDRLGASDWSRVFAMAVATLGTMLTAFLVVLNNHLHGAICATIALYAALRIWQDDDLRPRWFILAGFFAALTAASELPALSFFCLLGLFLLFKSPGRTIFAFAPAALVVVAAFFATNYIAHDSFRPPYAHRSETNPDDNWYDYSYMRGDREIDSYWRNPSGIDRGEPSQSRYALHVLVGHHGIFSLTPVWLLSAAGLLIWLVKGPPLGRKLAVFIGILSVVCLAFYLAQPQMNRNYGGMTSGFRWMFWFAPLWTLALLPAADRLARGNWTRGLALVLLALSVMSAAYPTWNPWTHPWLTNFMVYLGWVKF